MSTEPDDAGFIYDALVVGGGPAGSAAALRLAQLGRRVCLLDKARHPRFHVGESLIPQDLHCFDRLGLTETIRRLPQARKRGVEFALGDGSAGSRIRFRDALTPGLDEAFNIERAVLDDAMLRAAADAGAEVRQGTAATGIDRLTDGDVRLRITDKAGREHPLHGRALVDASGQATLVGRHLGTRKRFADPRFHKVAYFGHFLGVDRDNPLGDDDITMVLCDEGWFWMIPIDRRRTSVGVVLDPATVGRSRQPKGRVLAWAVDRCPVVRDRLRHARWPDTTGSISDYSYTCAPYAGPGHYLVGDAATFLDPVFSTGLYLGMEGGLHAADAIHASLDRPATAGRQRERYCRTMAGAVSQFFRLIEVYYEPSFRDLFLHHRGPLRMPEAVVDLLAGRVLPRPAWPVRWRMRLFYASVQLQRILPLAPHCGRFSLWQESAAAASGAGAGTDAAPHPVRRPTLV